MARVPAGIQLGKSVRPGLLRMVDALAAGLLLIAGWGGISLLAARSELASAGLPETGGSPASETLPALEAERAREAAAVLIAGVMDAPDLASAFGIVMATAPPSIRIAGIEIRPSGDAGGVEAVIAAEGESAAAVANFLTALADHESVSSTEVISETRQLDGAATVRITAQLDLAGGPEEQE